LLLIDQLEDLDDLPIGEVGPNLGELVLVDLGESMLPYRSILLFRELGEKVTSGPDVITIGREGRAGGNPFGNAVMCNITALRLTAEGWRGCHRQREG